jgi:hypothetical protein
LTLILPATITAILIIVLLFLRKYHRIVSFKLSAVVLALLFAGLTVGAWFLSKQELPNYGIYIDSIVTTLIGVVGYFYMYEIIYKKQSSF